MIVSHQHKFVFFAIPKTATHSVRTALQALLVEGDWQQQALFAEQRLPISQLAQIEHGHISYLQLLRHWDKLLLQDYFKFAFVRNPYDRFISVCSFLNRNNPHFQEQSLLWMKSALCRPQFRQRVLVQPQVKQLCDERGNLAMDFCGRFERLYDDLVHVFEQAGSNICEFKPLNLPHLNASQHKAYQNYYDEELKDMVAQFYKDDLELFDYHF